MEEKRSSDGFGLEQESNDAGFGLEQERRGVVLQWRGGGGETVVLEWR